MGLASGIDVAQASVMSFLRERLGEAVGAVLAPVVQQVSRARRARTFHPDGLVFQATVTSLDDGGEGSGVGQRLAGSALVRCSGALWRRGPQLPDVLGVAMRFRKTDALSVDVIPGDQDLLFATIVSPVTMPFSPFTTDVTDFSHNHFWAVSPFDVEGPGRSKLRLSPLTKAELNPGSREEKLRQAVSLHLAGWVLELRQTWSPGYRPIARIMLDREVQVDQAALHFSAFNDGLGFQPRGFVHAIRKAVYPASQKGRPATT